MSGDDRLERLKDLVARLEQLPASDARDRVLGEVRARAVDLDTGVTPRAMLPRDLAGRAVSARSDRRGAHAVPLPAPVKVAPPAPEERAPQLPTWSPAPAAASAASAIHAAIDLLAADERLCLEESPQAPAPGEQGHRPWARGLRG